MCDSLRSFAVFLRVSFRGSALKYCMMALVGVVAMILFIRYRGEIRSDKDNYAVEVFFIDFILFSIVCLVLWSFLKCITQCNKNLEEYINEGSVGFRVHVMEEDRRTLVNADVLGAADGHVEQGVMQVQNLVAPSQDSEVGYANPYFSTIEHENVSLSGFN